MSVVLKFKDQKSNDDNNEEKTETCKKLIKKWILRRR